MKKVNYVITVPDGDYCDDGEVFCRNYDNHGGGARCELGFGCYLEKDKERRVLKPKECKDLGVAE